MKTTIELPDDLLRRTKIAAAETGSTIRNLVIEGLETVLAASQSTDTAATADALRRLKTGFHLGGRPLTREEIHAR